MPDPGPADVAVVGAGPAGIAAATVAAESGKRVFLLDEGPRPGGQIWRHRATTPPPRARTWLSRLERSGAVRIAGASVFAIDPGFALHVERNGAPAVYRARSVVLATGAREIFLPFPGWTLPNVFGIGGAQALLKSGTSFSGRRVVVAGSGPLLLPVAASLAKSRARVALVAEQASRSSALRFAAGLWRSPRILADAFGYRRRFLGTPYRFGTWVVAARGDGGVEEVELTDGRRRWSVACDVLCTGYGLVPAPELARLAGCRTRGDAVEVDDAQATSVPGVFCAGEPTGIGGVGKALVEGRIAGLVAAGRRKEADRLVSARRRLDRYGRRIAAAFALRPELRALAAPDTIVCRCEDVPFSAFARDWSAREAKLATRAGMGPCQGRVCGPALRYLFAWESDSVRVPISPVSVETLATIGAQAPEESR